MIQPTQALHFNKRCGYALIVCVLSVLAACTKAPLDVVSREEKIAHAVKSLEMFNFDEAYLTLKEIKPQISPSDPNWPLLTYCLAISAWHKSPSTSDAIEEAQQFFNEVIETVPTSEFAASSLLELGRIYEIVDFRTDVPDLVAARECYERVRRLFPQTDMSARATLFLAQTYAQELNRADAEIAANVLINEMAAQPDSPWFGTMAQFAAQIYAYYIDDPAKAAEFYAMALDAGFPRPADADLSLWQYALLAEEAKQDAVAADIYTQLVMNYPRSIFGSIARQRVILIAERNPQLDIEIPELAQINLGR